MTMHRNVLTLTVAEMRRLIDEALKSAAPETRGWHIEFPMQAQQINGIDVMHYLGSGVMQKPMAARGLLAPSATDETILDWLDALKELAHKRMLAALRKRIDHVRANAAIRREISFAMSCEVDHRKALMRAREGAIHGDDNYF